MPELTTPTDAIVEALLFALELRNLESMGHSNRVAVLSIRIAKSLDVASEELTILRRGALLHDIGRIGIPDQILNKPGTLTPQEWEIIKKHPEQGAQLIQKIPSLTATAPIIHCHHERWDGTGYPQKQQGEAIPLLARICSVAEVFDSLVSEQAYRQAMLRNQALGIIDKDSGKAFDPTVVEVFRKIG